MATVTTKPPAPSAFGVDGVVVVLGVGRVDGDERQRAPVLAMRHRRGPRRVRLRERGGGECVGQAVRGDGDAADRALGVDRPEPLDDAGGGSAEAALA